MASVLHQRLMTSTFLIASMVVGSPALAQSTNNAPTSPPAGTVDQTTGARQTSDIGDTNCPPGTTPGTANCPSTGGGDIVVTGSRIASPALTSPSPSRCLRSEHHRACAKA